MKKLPLFFLVIAVIAIVLPQNIIAQDNPPLYPPDSLTAIAPDDAAILSWFPPSDTCCPPSGQLPEGLLGYNIYKNQEFLAYAQHEPPGVYTQQGFVEEGITPGYYEYTVTAVYDLAPYGFPGDTAESEPEGPAIINTVYLFELEFIETWDSGNFEENYWTIGSDNWSINGQEGQPAPTAEFTWDPIQENYSIALESNPISALGMTEGNIWLDFNLKLDAVISSGSEMMNVEIWTTDSQTWTTLEAYSNASGSFDWAAVHINISSYAMGIVFKVRFLATGMNSLGIFSWFVDNIHVYRVCHAPYELSVDYTGESVILEWNSDFGPPYVPEWIYWDGGVNYGNAYGTGSAVEFDCAARWEPAQMIYWGGTSVVQIAFFPADLQATYNVRVWEGENASELIYDDLVESPVVGEWNLIMLNNPVPVDISQELWIGYHVSALGGYPAGVDNGPAVEGYGDMINLGGWQTLQSVDSAYDCNWNISAQLLIMDENQQPETNKGPRDFKVYNIYRSIENEEYVFLDSTTEINYLDDSLPGASLYCYRVSAIWESETDICESPFTNDECLFVGTDDPDPGQSFSIYPNPASDHLVIIPDKGIFKEAILLSLYNSTGSLLQNINYRNADSDEMMINLNGYPPGIYWITIGSEKQVSGAEKFIISR